MLHILWNLCVLYRNFRMKSDTHSIDLCVSFLKIGYTLSEIMCIISYFMIHISIISVYHLAYYDTHFMKSCVPHGSYYPHLQDDHLIKKGYTF